MPESEILKEARQVYDVPSLTSLSGVRQWLLSFPSATELSTDLVLAEFDNEGIDLSLVDSTIVLGDEKTLQARMTKNELVEYGAAIGEPCEDVTQSHANSEISKVWCNVQQVKSLIAILERSADDANQVGNFTILGAGQWLRESLWAATGVLPQNPGLIDGSIFEQAWYSVHPYEDEAEEDSPVFWDYVPISAGIARAATAKEIWKALSWTIPESARRGLLWVLVAALEVIAFGIAVILKHNPVWGLPLACTIVAVPMYCMANWIIAKVLSDYSRFGMLISEDDKVVIGLKLSNTGAGQTIEVHNHIAKQIGGELGKKFREKLIPDVKEFISDNPLIALHFTASNKKTADLFVTEIAGAFPSEDGWVLDKSGNRFELRKDDLHDSTLPSWPLT